MGPLAETSALLGLLLLALAGAQLARGQQGEPRARWELKFQNEPPNGTLSKWANQQQVFKCQVRLAPGSAFQTGPGQTRRRSRSNFRLLLGRGEAAPASDVPADKWAPNASLSIEWLKDGQPLGEAYASELVNVLNVSLKRTDKNLQQQQQQQPKPSSNNRPRLEVKNTLNGQQLKLTSRLKLAHLRPSDSGRFRCLARAQFEQQQDGLLVEQSLESDTETTLLVTSGGEPMSGGECSLQSGAAISSLAGP